ncbi:MAG: AAA family ATPase [Anaerolineae bacterium]
MVGLPGSGKSTWVKNNIVPPTRVVQPDAIRREVFGVQFDVRVEPAVWQIVRAMVSGYLTLGFSVVLDATNLTTRRRIPFIRIAQRHQAKVEAVVVATAVEECLRRNAQREAGQRVPPQVIINKSRYIEWPSYGEGIEEIKYVF